MLDRISIIIPVLNEAEGILDTLLTLQPLRARAHDVILVDGGSTDNTVDIAAPYVDKVVCSQRGRARQMNAGAREAMGTILWFLHADTRIPVDADAAILDALAANTRLWGRFDVRLSGSAVLLRVVEKLMNWRSRFTGIATGDQGIFVRRAAFEIAGRFPDIALMEDVAMSCVLKRSSRPVCLRQTLLTSSRRWEAGGIVRTILLMWHLRLAYFLGADPARLAQRYRTP